MFAVDPYAWLIPALVVLVAVVVGLIWRGRNGSDRRPGPVTYFLYGLSFVCLVLMLVGTGVGVHATAQAIGPSSSGANFGNFEGFQPCPTQDTTTPSTTIPQDQLPCIDFGQSGPSRVRPHAPTRSVVTGLVVRIRFVSWLFPPGRQRV